MKRMIWAIAAATMLASSLSAETILMLRSGGDAFEEVAQSLKERLATDFTIREEIITDQLPIDKTQKLIDESKPSLVILMNNNSVKSYKAYQGSLTTGVTPIPSLSLMTALLPAQIKGMTNATGITYEVPIVTSVVNLRSMLNIETVKLGVVYREFLKPFVDENAEYCKKENIQLIRGFVPSDNSNYQDLLKKGLELLVTQKGANMIWVPNDPAFLKPEIIRDVWIPFSESHAIPIIVGVESMLSTNVNFGTYAVLPDHNALGQQAADLVYTIRDAGWKVDLSVVEPPISIYQVLNPKKINKKYKIDEATVEVDKVVK